MRRRHLTLISALGGMGLVMPGTRAAGASPAEALRHANAAFAAALSARDLAGLEALWAQDETAMALHPLHRHPARGWDAVRRAWQQVFAEHAEFSVSMPAPRIHLMGEAALVAGLARIEGRRADGTPVSFEAMVTNGYERRGDRWLLVQHHTAPT